MRDFRPPSTLRAPPMPPGSPSTCPTRLDDIYYYIKPRGTGPGLERPARRIKNTREAGHPRRAKYSPG